MASSADPYSAFNFLLEWSHPDTNNKLEAGFTEVSGLGKEVTVAEYRDSNNLESDARKVAGVSKSSNITLKRGLMVAKDLFEWVKMARDGSMLRIRTVDITLRDDDGAGVMKWRLSSVLPLKWTEPSLNSKDTEIVIEELVLGFEVMEIEAIDQVTVPRNGI